MSIAENIARLKEEIATACRKAGRDEREIALMAVSKMHPVEAILESWPYLTRAQIYAALTYAWENREEILGLIGQADEVATAASQTVESKPQADGQSSPAPMPNNTLRTR